MTIITTLTSLVMIVAVVAGAVLVTHKAKADELPATAHVNVDYSNGQMPATAIGVNEAAWDDNMTDSNYQQSLNYADVSVMRYPGGSTADNFHWYNQSLTVVDPNIPPQTPGAGTLGSDGIGVNFDHFMSAAYNAGAQAMITVNYGSGSAQEAADWVAYANTYDNYCYSSSCLQYVPTYAGASSYGNAYGVKYWEIGNEVYGDGSYFNNDPGSHWEMNNNLVGPTNYANGVVAYSQAMKNVDPSIAIGAVLTAPGNWPDGYRTHMNLDGTNATPYPQTWNDTVLSTACSSIDFVDIHWYPQAYSGSGNGGESDSQLLAAPQQGIADHGRTPAISGTQSKLGMVQTLRNEINKWCGPHASAVQIMVTETNSVYDHPGKQTTSVVNALFLADSLMTWYQYGVANVDWWAGHNSPYDGNGTDYVTGGSLFGDYNFGDFGLFSTGQCTNGGACEPATGTAFPAFYGMEMLSFLTYGSPSINIAGSDTPDVSVYATSKWDAQAGDLSGVEVMLINKSASNTYDETVDLTNESSSGLAGVNYYGEGITNIWSNYYTFPINGSSFQIQLPPYSITVVSLPQTTCCN